MERKDFPSPEVSEVRQIAFPILGVIDDRFSCVMNDRFPLINRIDSANDDLGCLFTFISFVECSLLFSGALVTTPRIGIDVSSSICSFVYRNGLYKCTIRMTKVPAIRLKIDAVK